MLIHEDHKNHFISFFDEENGIYMRSGLLLDNRETEDPFMSDFPELLDIGIMGHCRHGISGKCLKANVECYQNGISQIEENMSLEDFEMIIKQCVGRTFQIALGGRGDPDQHEHFEDILKICRYNDIVPNLTSSGYGFNDEIVHLCKKYCGAVAISWYRSDYTLKAINLLLKEKVKTNIHYVLNNKTIDEAIERLKNNDFPKGINAVIFLLHKPIGLGSKNQVLKVDDPKVIEFFHLIDNNSFDFKIGFDSCSIPGLINYTHSLDIKRVDTCESGRWSAYITPDMKMLPCSFDNQQQRWAVDLREYSIHDAWYSETFEEFRNHFIYSCPACPQRLSCMGGCPISSDIVLCNKKS